MGANQSYEGRINNEGTASEIHISNNNLKAQSQHTTREIKHHKVAESGGKKHKAKPGPPHKPKVVEATHDCLTLSWQPPRCNPAHNYNSSSHFSSILAYTVEMTKFSCAGKNKRGNGDSLTGNGSGPAKSKPGQWTTLTKACQATSYSARDLEPDTTYAFRVRAENLYGTGKPSVPCDPVTTRMYETTIRDSFIFMPSGITGASQISVSPAPLSEKPYVHGLPSPTSSSSSPSPPPQTLENNGGHRLRRRHSFNIHLDGGAVNKIANHSDLVVSNAENLPKAIHPNYKMSQSNSCHASLSPESLSLTSSSSSASKSSSSSSLFPTGFSPKHRYSERRRGLSGQENAPGDRMNRVYERATNPNHTSAAQTSLNRKNSYTSSRGIPSSSLSSGQGRKISLPILLPGTGTASLSKLRESRTSLRSSVSDVNSGQGQSHSASGMHEVMLVTVDRGKTSGTLSSSRRRSNGSLGSSDNISAIRDRDRDRYSRASSSNGSGGSEVNSSQISLEGSVSSSEMSRGPRDNLVSTALNNVVNGKGREGLVGDSRCGSYNSLSVRSSRSNVTLSNSKDSLCDLTSSNHSSVGDGIADDVDSKGHADKLKALENTEDDCKLNGMNNNMDDDKVKQRMESFLKPGDLDNCDDIYKLKEQLRNFEITEENLRFHDLGQSMNCHRNRINDPYNTRYDSSTEDTIENGSYYASLENPWEKEDSSVTGLSERILAAPFSDDIKIALYARDLPENPALKVATPNNVSSGNRTAHQQSATSCSETGDFRTLRSVLQSGNMFVKAQRFSPDVVGVIVGDESDTCRMLTRAPLTTIADADEDEDPVRITTL